MAKGREVIGARFAKYLRPVLDALRELGDSGRASEVTDVVAENLRIPERERDKTNASGQKQVYNDVAFARLYLSKEGFLDSSRRGVWSLTEKGRSYAPTREECIDLVKRVVQRQAAIRQGARKNDQVREESVECDPEDVAVIEEDYRTALLATLKGLTPSGFESFCKELLREGGFESVVVTGQTGDGGIDGHGVLQINALVSLKVLFQCKRYDDSIGPEKVRAFRGAVGTFGSRGILLTTGTFTKKAREEAVKDETRPIELVDGERIVDMCERLEFGLKQKSTFELDRGFFTKFEDGSS